MSSETVTKSSVVCRLSKPLPTGTIDSHNHIIPPDFDRFPTVSTAEYQPKPHTISDAVQFYAQTSGLGISTPRMVLTQVSVYGHDNSALLSGVKELGNNGRGVVECTPDVSIEQLEKWWQLGIRGVRINLVSVSRKVDEPEMKRMLQAYTDMLGQTAMSDASRKWVIDLHFPLGYMSMLLSILRRLDGADRVRWCIDHFGGLKFKTDAPNFQPGNDDPYTVSGFKELVTLVTDQSLPEVYVKLSAAYRVDADYPNEHVLRRLEPFGKELVSKAEDRVLWASDWPHTRFENVDSVPFVEACYEWCGGEGEEGQRRREKLFRSNSEKLWDMA
ncbi:hypothetical protein H2198_006160 [Neophaeococcomyces mojaviensis]|uniref:Uncharacterized protein n=1 Tax=Neophaeococcomyces mojaviensis TaxID=3383035 RepID=A0ACC3A3P5_9EURO|nr:hypothetical protein H2198_006160 [Knufia sp. JES_112]